MEAKALVKDVRMSAQKTRLVANLIRGYDFQDAVDILKHTPKKAARIILKVVKSAAANAKVLNPDLEEKDLFVKKIFVDEGPTWKRMKPRARGSADRIFRRNSKVTVVLSDE